MVVSVLSECSNIAAQGATIRHEFHGYPFSAVASARNNIERIHDTYIAALIKALRVMENPFPCTSSFIVYQEVLIRNFRPLTFYQYSSSRFYEHFNLPYNSAARMKFNIKCIFDFIRYFIQYR